MVMQRNATNRMQTLHVKVTKGSYDSCVTCADMFAADKIGVTELVLRVLECASLPSCNQVDCCWLCAYVAFMFTCKQV